MRRGLKAAALAGALFVGLWTLQLNLRAAPASAAGPPPAPAALGAFADDPPIDSAEDWLARRAPLLRAAFQNLIYGAPPAASTPIVRERRLIDHAAFGGAARIEELTLEIESPRGAVTFALLLFTPTQAAAPAPVVIAPNFCGNAAALGYRYAHVSQPDWIAPRCRTLAGRTLTRTLHGANIVRPPFAEMLRDGYAVASFSPGEIAPDDAALARMALARLPDASADRLGAVGAWAWSISRVVDVIEREASLDAERIAVFGHSRFGKAALWAAAMDTRITLVVANQSGRLGAAPSRSPAGETLAHISRSFPHWWPSSAKLRRAAEEEIDQHLLLALIAPRPILLGGAWMDRWSDPAGAFRAAEAASPVYRLFGRVGLDQPDMQSTNLQADIAVFMRAGGHGVRAHDWRTALAFIDAHFKSGA